jgi:GNAT superfamily N-acetyltransferase
MYPLADLELSRRLERCEARANAAFVESRARRTPEIGAQWIECAGAYAMFDGVGSPLTQTFGLGLFETPRAEDLERIETFFTERGAEVFHEVSPLAGVEFLTARGYRPIELTSVMYQPIVIPSEVEGPGGPGGARHEPPGPPGPSTDARDDRQGPVTTRLAEPHELDLWSETAAEGWREFTEVAPLMRELGRIAASAEGSSPFFAELDGRPIGTGALTIHGGVALLAGASTVPEARRQGAQRALLAARLRHAAAQGCDLAMMCAQPGSASQRNAERQGFRIAYTRIKWGRPPAQS